MTETEFIGIAVKRSASYLTLPKGRYFQETLFLAPDRVIIERIEKRIVATSPSEYSGLEVEERNREYLSIPKSEITKVELERGLFGRGVKLNIITNEKEYKWRAVGLVPEKKGVRLEDYEDILRPVFGDRLSVKD